MKKNLLVVALLMSAVGAFAQGSINFNNRATSGAPAPVVAPIFDTDPNNRTQQKQGNPATFATAPVPVGTQTYAGAPLVGTGYTAQLWAANSTLADSAMVPISSAPFRVTTNPALFGFVNPPIAPIVPGVAAGTSDRAKFQLRVWDNRGGTITSWDQLYDATTGAANQANAGVARGWSTVFAVNAGLGGGTGTPPNLVGLESFQLFIVPEPSTIALGVLGAGCLFLLRRRK
jgi:hypothetical protein